MCFHPRLHPLILDKGSLAINRLQWIRFKILEGGHLKILDPYASNMLGERCGMWHEILHCLSTNYRWIIDVQPVNVLHSS